MKSSVNITPVKIAVDIQAELEKLVQKKSRWTPEMDEIIQQYGLRVSWVGLSSVLSKMMGRRIPSTSIRGRYMMLTEKIKS